MGRRYQWRMSGPSVSRQKCCPMMLLARLLLQVVVAGTESSANFARAATVRLNPPHMLDLMEGESREVFVSIRVPRKEFDNEAPGPWKLSLASMHPSVAVADVGEIDKTQFSLENDTSNYAADKVVSVSGRLLGKTRMQFRLVRAESWLEEDTRWMGDVKPVSESNSMDVWVKRNKESERLTRAFVASVIVLMTIAGVMMGCELDMSVVLETLRRPIAPAIGLFAQFIIMPILAYAIARAIFVPKGEFSFALGLLISGCSPGGGASNFWTLLLGGNVNLSVTMTFLSTLVSLVMMPFWMSLVGGEFLQGFSSTKISIPYSHITRTLASLVVPLMVGVAIKKYKPTWAARSRKMMRPFVIFVMVFVIGFGIVSNTYMFRIMNLNALIGGLLLPWCGFMFGCFTSILLRRPPADVTAIAVETGIQNTGIAILMLKASFGQPDADIGAVVPVIVACFTPFPLLFGAAVHMVIKRWKDSLEKGVSLEAAGSSSSTLLVKGDIEKEGDPLDKAVELLEKPLHVLTVA